ncbi:hypothetical protein [Polaribacter atrinae]|nr:hypothetical protein [Polaribacter atrinae]
MKKNKLPNLLKTGILLFGISILLWNCQNIIDNEKVNLEKSVIDYGISKEKLLNLKTTKRVAAKIKGSKKSNSLLNKTTAGELTFEELVERLNLENTYYSLTDSTEVLSAPVKTLGNYKRVLFSVTTGEINNSYLLTYPNPQDTKTFYVSNLYGKLLQKVVIQPNGIGKVVSYSSNNTLAKGDFCGDQTVYETCSSGSHSFQNEDTVWECDYWTDLSSGTPPSLFTISGDCGGSSGGGSPSNDDTSGNPTNTGGGVSTAPSGGGGLPTNLEQECVASLDCEECDLPGDLNRDCTIDEYEGCRMLGYSDEVCVCSVNGGNIDECTFDEQVFIDDSFKDNSCLKSVYDKMGKATKFKEYLQNFKNGMSVADLRFTTDDNFSGNEDADYHNAMAITKPPLANNEIKIKFNTDTSTTGNILNKPDVFKAVSMIHEVIHAEMYRKMLDAMIVAQANGTTLDWTDLTYDEFRQYIDVTLQNKYFGIWDYYVRYDDNDDTPDNGQHQQMAQHYRDIVKQALTDYDPTLTEEQKEALSWIGLNEANIVAWQNLDEDPNLNTQQEQAAINTTITQIKNTFPNECN